MAARFSDVVILTIIYISFFTGNKFALKYYGTRYLETQLKTDKPLNVLTVCFWTKPESDTADIFVYTKVDKNNALYMVLKSNSVKIGGLASNEL